MVSDVFLVTGNAGQGKTTVAVNLAVALRSFGFDVLLVDACLQTPRVGHQLGMPLVGRTMQRVLDGSCSLRDAVYTLPSGLRVVFSGLSGPVVSHPAKLLPELKALAQVVIVDVPSFDDRWYVAGEKTLLVCHPDFPSALEAGNLAKQASVAGVVLNRVHNDGVGLSPGNVQQVVGPVIGVVPEERGVREALRAGYSLLQFKPDANASVVLKQIAANLMKVEYSPQSGRAGLLERLGLVS